MRQTILAALGTAAALLLIGMAGTLETTYDRAEVTLREMDESTFYALQEHIADSTGVLPTRTEVAEYYIEHGGLRDER